MKARGRAIAALGVLLAPAPGMVAALALMLCPVPARGQTADSVLSRPPRARRAPRAAGQSLTLSAGLSSAYDSNLLQYSADQLASFESGIHPGRFSIHTSDDLTWNPALELVWELDRGRGRRHALRLKTEGDFHQQNGTGDFHSASISWYESFRGGRQLAVGGYALPQYYVRQLSDDDVVPPYSGLTDYRYRRAEFALGIASASWSQRVGRRGHLALGYQFERRRYNADFTERDSDVHQGEATWGWMRLPRRGTVELHAGYRTSDAKASDGDEPPGTVPDDADLSYHGWIAGIAGRMTFVDRARLRLGADLAYAFASRSYDSDRPADRYHFGRNDSLHGIELGLRAQARPHWSARGFYRYEWNDASLGRAAPPTTDSGSYRQHQVGLALGWSGGIWHSRGATAGETQE
jgi:hypothetical protein